MNNCTYIKKSFLLLSAAVLLAIQSFAKQDSTSVQPFLPEIISAFPSVRDITIAPNGNEIYFTAQSLLGEVSTIFFIKKNNNNWSQPEIVSFSGAYHDLEPFFSPDGLRLYFASDRPLDQQSAITKDYDIYYVERKDLLSAWSAAINIGTPVNTSKNEFYPSVSTKNTLVFTSDWSNSKGEDDIFISEFKDGKFQEPVSMSDSINTAGYEFNAFIAPDESYLIFTGYNRSNGLGSGDLYISYNKKGVWTKAQNLGKKINSAQMDYCPFVFDNKLFFTSKRSAVQSPVGKKQVASEIIKEINRYDNGQSRLYVIDIKNFIKN